MIDLHLIPIDSDSIAYDGFHLPLRYDGGVAMYNANNIAFVERNDLSTPGLEIIWCEIHICHKKIFVGVLYMLVDFFVQILKKYFPVT